MLPAGYQPLSAPREHRRFAQDMGDELPAGAGDLAELERLKSAAREKDSPAATG